MLGQCSSLAELNLQGNGIGVEGARRLLAVLGQSSSPFKLNLGGNRFRVDVHSILRSSI